MPFGVIHRFAGGTQEQYENAIKAVHPNGGKGLPEGQTVHIAGFNILECADLDEAIEVASKNPGASFGILELRAIEP